MANEKEVLTHILRNGLPKSEPDADALIDKLNEKEHEEPKSGSTKR
jgi:hypothetical protein